MSEPEQSTPQDVIWHAMISAKLAEAIKVNTAELINCRQDAPLSRVAWLVRNLLELLIWTDYCGKSTLHSRRFYLDSLRDWVDLVHTLQAESATTPEIALVSGQLTSNIPEVSECLEMFEPHRRRVSIYDAARDIGRLSFYKVSNKILSKFAHPTALSIILPITDEKEVEIRNIFIRSGLDMAKEAAEKGKLFTKQDTAAVELPTIICNDSICQER